eukprot:766709-Hanusia_phi.AAC.4
MEGAAERAGAGAGAGHLESRMHFLDRTFLLQLLAQLAQPLRCLPGLLRLVIPDSQLCPQSTFASFLDLVEALPAPSFSFSEFNGWVTSSSSSLASCLSSLLRPGQQAPQRPRPSPFLLSSCRDDVLDRCVHISVDLMQHSPNKSLFPSEEGGDKKEDREGWKRRSGGRSRSKKYGKLTVSFCPVPLITSSSARLASSPDDPPRDPSP